MDGLKLRNIFCFWSRRVEDCEAKWKEIEQLCDSLQLAIDYATKENNKALVQGRKPPKVYFKWVEEARKIVDQVNGISKPDIKCCGSSNAKLVLIKLQGIYQKIDNHLKKSPYKLD